MIDKKLTLDLGERKGKLLFFGGVYSNLEALIALKEWSSENSFEPDQIFCNGDIGGYCANPIECFEMIQDWKIHAIAGNVELQLRDDEDDCGCDFTADGRCDLFSKTWYSYLKKNTSAAAKNWLHTLPHHITFTYAGHRFAIVHGSFSKTSEFIFKSTPWEIKKNNFDATSADTIIAGHCGLPFIDHRDNKTWLNPGVIGMPANDGATNVWFATAEITEGTIEYKFHQLQYDYKKARKSMMENDLPAAYAKTLVTGIWDNCEILPDAETKQQGIKISL